MEPFTMTPDRRLAAHQIYGRAADAVAWRPPVARRFDARPANDIAEPDSSVAEPGEAFPRWIITIGGGVIAALTGALVGGALHI